MNGIRDQKFLSIMARVLPMAVAALVLAAFLIGFLIPIYSDEVAILMSRSRFFVEDGHLVNLFPQCNSSIDNPLALTWYPAAIVYAVLYAGLNSLGLRLMGIVLGLAWLGLLWFWAGKQQQNLLPRAVFQALIVSLNGVGVLPFVLVLARSEQFLIVCLASFCLFALYWRLRETDHVLVKGLKTILFLLIASLFFYAHPKALFFSPVVVVAAWITFREASGYLRIATMLIVLFAVFQAVQQAQKVSGCPQAPRLAQVLAQHTIKLDLLRSDKAAFYNNAKDNLLFSLDKVLQQIPVKSAYQSGWLPPSKFGVIEPVIPTFNGILQQSLFFLCAGLVCILAIQLQLQLFRMHISARTLLGGVLAVGLLGHAAVYNLSSWHFYTPGFIIPAVILLLLLVLPERIQGQWIARGMAQAFTAYWLVLVLLSVALLFYATLPSLVKTARMNDYVLPNQPLSTPVFITDERQADLRTLMQKCDIDQSSERLVVDGPAYFLLQRHKEPINVLYVSEYGFGMDIGSNIGTFLKNMNSDGVLARCEYLPQALQDKAITLGKMCCVSKSAWAR